MLNIFYAFILMMATILLRLIMVENIQIAIMLLVYLSSLFILAMESRSLNYMDNFLQNDTRTIGSLRAKRISF